LGRQLHFGLTSLPQGRSLRHANQHLVGASPELTDVDLLSLSFLGPTTTFVIYTIWIPPALRKTSPVLHGRMWSMLNAVRRSIKGLAENSHGLGQQIFRHLIYNVQSIIFNEAECTAQPAHCTASDQESRGDFTNPTPRNHMRKL
jgi:hypothetical protein